MKPPIFIVALLLAAPAFAYENEPTGFRGIEWETPIEKVQEEFVALDPVNGNRGFYSRKGDKMRIGEAQLEMVNYFFYKGRFSSAMIRTVEGITHQRALRAAFTEQFGHGYQPNRYIERWLWTGPTTTIFLDCAVKRYCNAIMRSKALRDEEARDKKAAAQEAGKDL